MICSNGVPCRLSITMRSQRDVTVAAYQVMFTLDAFPRIHSVSTHPYSCTRAVVVSDKKRFNIAHCAESERWEADGIPQCVIGTTSLTSVNGLTKPCMKQHKTPAEVIRLRGKHVSTDGLTDDCGYWCRVSSISVPQPDISLCRRRCESGVRGAGQEYCTWQV
jgi:hypothetical protein